MARVDQILFYTNTQHHIVQILVYHGLLFIIAFHVIAVVMNATECLGDRRWQGFISVSLTLICNITKC